MINRKEHPVGWNLLLYELHDAHEHLGKLIEDMSANTNCAEEEFRIDLGHVYAHLNRAWFRRNVDGDCSDAEWETATQFPIDLAPV